MARTFWPGENALGKCLIFGEPDAACHPVVGITEDSRRWGIIEDPAMQYFRPRESDATGGAILFRVDPRQWNAVAEVVRSEFGDLFGQRDVSIRRMTEALEPQLRPWRLGAQLFTAFGLLALAVTLVGVYSVTAYAASLRRHEMGVRMAIGAQVRDIMALVVASGARVVAFGVLVGIAVSLALGRIIESLLFEVTARDPVALSAASLMLLIAGAAASVVPAWRAGRVDPARTLREE
jgi:ABC-type antimicrobial peptide transport system permease subunit